jgi:hypothetical protein
MPNTKHYFSESSLARYLGTTRYRLQRAKLPVSFKSGIQKLYALDESELVALQQDFQDENGQIVAKFSAASPKEQQSMASNPEIFHVLKTRLHPALFSEQQKQAKGKA